MYLLRRAAGAFPPSDASPCPSAENQEVQYCVLSGFVFLRFFAPALLNPKLFDLTQEQLVSLPAVGLWSVGSDVGVPTERCGIDPNTRHSWASLICKVM